MRIRRFITLLISLSIFSLALSPTSAQIEPDIISPNIFLRGIVLPTGVRYTAAFIKPVDDMALRNISVEITLPADAQFVEMLVSRQVQFDVIRQNRQGQLTFIWQISRVAVDTALDSFSFTLTEPLSSDIEFLMTWQDEQGQGFLENFFENPPTVEATETNATITTISDQLSLIDKTGIQVAAPIGRNLTLTLLANDFNPPPEYGAVWWCSLLELTGLAESEIATVIVPLRRPIAPFSELFLFQQQADGTWIALPEKGVVTADGQFVMYRHPGGLVATGGEQEIQQESVPAESAIIEIVNDPLPVNTPVPVPVQPTQQSPDDTSNANITEIPNTPQVIVANDPIRDGTNNTIIIAEITSTPLLIAPVRATRDTQDGTSNTIDVSEVTSAPTVVLTPTSTTFLTPNSTQDGTSNTIDVSEVTSAPTVALTPTSTTFITPSSTQDGTSNTIDVSEVTSAPTVALTPTSTTFLTPSSTQDGTSNTIVLSEVTSAPTVALTPTSTQDGTSNTIVVSEVTSAPTVVLTPTSIQDGTSNTIVVSEVTSAPTVALTPTSTQDGNSNTIVVSEVTSAPTQVASTTVPNSSPTPILTSTPLSHLTVTPFVVMTLPAFGQRSARVFIFITQDGEVVQCQVGRTQCATLRRHRANRE